MTTEAKAPVRIVVRFRQDPDGEMQGKIIGDRLRRKRSVFIDRYWRERKGITYVAPKSEELWECEVVRDTRSANHLGCMYVRLIAPAQRPSEFSLVDGRPLYIAQKLEAQFKDGRAGMMAAMPEIAAQIVVPSLRKHEFKISIGQPCFRENFVDAPTVTPAEPCLFARVKGKELAQRVIEVDPVLHYTNSAIILLTSHARMGGCEIRELYGSSTHFYPARYPKCEQLSPGSLAHSLKFWCTHANVYHPDLMEEPFESTWDAIMQERF